MIPLRVFIGYDSREPVAYHVFVHSILRRASVPIAVTPLVRASLTHLYARERSPLESTEFALTRFLVPALCQYEGTALFVDSDMLCRVDIAELWDAALGPPSFARERLCPDQALWVCQHDYTPKAQAKMDGRVQTAYPRKNWSSLMLFNNERCRALTPDYVNSATGLELHRLAWLTDRQVGSLPLEWNYLVDEPGQALEPPKIVHFTNGGPWFPEYADVEFADDWRDEFRSMTGGS